MKKILLSSLVAAAAAVPAFAGVNNLNYQAVIKNGGNVLVDQQVNLKFELLDNSDKVVFTEVQSPKTNGAGYVACQLGQENDLSELNWGDLKLRVSIDLGSGYQVFSTEEVSSVPTALYALKSADSDMIIEAVEGLVADNEETKSRLNSMSADVAQIEGLSEQLEEIGIEIVNLAEFKDSANAQLENLNNVAAVTRANEEAIEMLTPEVEKLVQANEETQGRLNSYGADIAQIEGLANEVEVLQGAVQEMLGMNDKENLEMVGKLSTQVGDLTTEVEGLVKDNAETQERLNAYGAEIARIEGIAQDFENLGENLDNAFGEMEAKFKDVEGQLENLNNVAAVIRVNEENIETLQGDFKNLGENLDNGFGEMDARFKDVEGQLENLNQVSAVVRANEEAIETLQADFKNLGENLDKSFEQMTAKFDEVEGQLENLNQVAAVVRANEQAIEELNTNVEAFADMVEARIDKVQNQVDLLTPEVEGLVKDNEETKQQLVSYGAEIGQIEGLASKVEAVSEEVKNIMDPEGPLAGQIGEVAAEVAELKDTLNQLIEALQDLEILPKAFK